MATAQQQASFRARDQKRLVQVRLSAVALAQLDALVEQRGASGRAEVVESMLVATATSVPTPTPPPVRCDSAPCLSSDGLFWR